MPIRNILQVWEQAFPEEFSSDLQSPPAATDDNKIEFFCLEQDQLQQQNQNEQQTALRRLRDQTSSSSDANSAAATLRKCSRPPTFPNHRSYSFLINEMLQLYKDKNSQQQQQEGDGESSKRRMQEAVLASLLNGHGTCLVEEDFYIDDDDNEIINNIVMKEGSASSSRSHRSGPSYYSQLFSQLNAAKRACTQTIAIATLLHTFHQFPSNIESLSERYQEQHQQQDNNNNNNSNNNNNNNNNNNSTPPVAVPNFRALMRPKSPIALIISSSPERSNEIMKEIRLLKSLYSPEQVSILNLDDDELKSKINSSSSVDPEIIIGCPSSIAKHLSQANSSNNMPPPPQQQQQQQNQQSNSNGNFLLSGDRISFVWIDHYDTTFFHDSRGGGHGIGGIHHHNQIISNLVTHHHPLRQFLMVQVASSCQFVVTLRSQMRWKRDLLFHQSSLSKLDDFVFIQHSWRRLRGEVKPKTDQGEYYEKSTSDSSSCHLLVMNVDYDSNDNISDDEQFLNTFIKKMNSVINDSGKNNNNVVTSFCLARVDPTQLTQTELDSYILRNSRCSGGKEDHDTRLNFAAILLSFANFDDRNLAFKKLNGRKYGNKFMYCLLSEIEFYILKDQTNNNNHNHQRPAIITKRVHLDPKVFQNNNNNNKNSSRCCCLVLRNVVHSVLDVFPKPSDSPTAKRIESMLLQQPQTANCVRKFSWWVIPDMQSAYTLSQDGRSARDCLENLPNGECRYHDEVRLILVFDNFGDACVSLNELLKNGGNNDNDDVNSSSSVSTVNYLEEGFKLPSVVKRQVTAHFIFHHHGNETCQPNTYVEPEVDADLLALESEDVE